MAAMSHPVIKTLLWWNDQIMISHIHLTIYYQIWSDFDYQNSELHNKD